MERLSIIPLAPPLETLSAIASLLCNGSNSAVEVIQEYLEMARGQKRVDLLSSFLCLLENEDDQIRLGSLVVLAILRVCYYSISHSLSKQVTNRFIHSE